MDINTLLENQNNEIMHTKKLLFVGTEGKDVYNISHPLIHNEETYLFGRVEPRDSSELSKVMLFKQRGEEWHKDETFSIFPSAEDPFITIINGEIILGFVEVFRMEKSHTFDPENFLNYRTVFYKGKSPHTLERFFEGPMKMKDIRLLELKDKRIAVCTRPQGAIGGRGKIGFTIINTLNDIEKTDLYNAPLLQDLFIEEEWGGANHMHLLHNGDIGILGHIAKQGEGNTKQYYPICFIINQNREVKTMPTIPFERKHVAQGEAKNDELWNVVFPGGMIRNKDKTATIYVGIGDAEAHAITIQDPFLSYENNSKTPAPH